MKVNILKKVLLTLILLLCLTMVSCGEDSQTDNSEEPNENPPVTENNPSEAEPDDSYTPQACGICDGTGIHAEKITYPALAAYTPTTFSASSVSKSSTTVTEGITQHTYTFKMNSNSNWTNGGKTVKVVVTEVDLNYASIAAGTYEDTQTVDKLDYPISMVNAFEEHNPDKTVITAVNGDFFGATCVNAFVKNSKIIKYAHNAPGQGTYDYTNIYNDIPASMPMLFGVSGKAAQVNPIIKNGTVKETIDSQLFYELTITHNSKPQTLASTYVSNEVSALKNDVNICTNKNKEYSTTVGSTVLQVKTHGKDGKYYHGEVMKIINITERNVTFVPTNEYYYVILPRDYNKPDIYLGDIISHEVASEDGTWNYYDEIIGCRQALVIEGNIPSTVKKENTNSAQSTNVPRTAVGVLPNGNVALFSVEALKYGKYGSSSDTYGLSLPQLADFMRYVGVYNGGNFDGGGSTQLITRKTPTSDFSVLVRSSDTGSYTVKSTRKVINCVMVYIKK